MSYVIVAPDALTATAEDFTAIDSALRSANAAAAAPTTGMLAAATDEVSVAITGLLNLQAQEYQAVSAQAAQYHARFVQILTAGGQWYAGTETAIASSLRNAEHQVRNFISLLLYGRPIDGARTRRLLPPRRRQRPRPRRHPRPHPPALPLPLPRPLPPPG